MSERLEVRLTARELQVARLVKDGLTDREIASRLFIGRRTAEWHVKQIFDKLGISSRSQLAAWTAEQKSAVELPVETEPHHNLPLQLTTFIGRSVELNEIQQLLETRRLVTLTGVAGAGKTRLALELAGRVLDRYPEGVRFVDLTPIREGHLITAAFASALAIRERPRQPMTQTLLEHLRDRRMLLVVDNCEHVIDACANLVNQIVRACHATSILATSREPLRINGETVAPVAPLRIPEASAKADPDAVATCESVGLFIDRTRLAAPGFVLTDRNADAVAELCRRLDGLPLAIELAAARVGVLTPADILDRLQSRFGLLAGGSRTGPARHQSLQSALDWSHDLLSSSERLLFRRLSVFAGTFSLEAIEQVCCDAQLSTADVVGVLSNLVEKSLVTAGTGDSIRRRFRMLDTLQQYARVRLEQSGELDLLLSHHSDFFLALAEAASPHLRSHERKRWREVLAIDISNMRAALAWSRESDVQKHLRITIALTDFWYINGLVQEGDEWFETALRAYRVRDGLRARALDSGSSISFWRADLERYASRCHEFLDIYRELGDQEGIRHGLWRVGEVEEWGGRPDLAKRYFEDALAAAKEAGDIGTVVVCLRNLGRLAMRARDHALARKYLQQSLEWNEQYGDLLQKNWGLMYLGLNAIDCGDASEARAFLQEAMRIGIESDWKVGVATPLMYFATLAAVEGDPIRAMRLAGASQALAESAGAAPIRLTRPIVHRWLDPVRSELGSELSEACTAEGRAMSWQAAIDYALTT